MLGDPTRVRILDALVAGELCVRDIAALVGISESAVSHQLRLLREHAPGAPAPRRAPGLLRARRPAHRRAASSRGSSTSRRVARLAMAMSTCTVCELHAESTFKIEGMDCREEVAILERRFKRPRRASKRLDADVMGQRLHVKYDAAKLSTGGDRRSRRRDRHARVARARGADRRSPRRLRRRQRLGRRRRASLLAAGARRRFWRRRARRSGVRCSSLSIAARRRRTPRAGRWHVAPRRRRSTSTC